MITVNIPSYHDDPNYRYKMPRVKVQTISRGNGVKTNLMNMLDIAKALKRSPKYSTKFCGCELGAMSLYDSMHGTAIINGVHTERDVQAVIDKFVDRFVLCPQCKLPEVDLFVDQNKVQGKCNACGFSGLMDNVHKVANYICRYPPSEEESTVRQAEKGVKAKRTSKCVDTDTGSNGSGEEEGLNKTTIEDVGETREERRERKERERRNRLEKQEEKCRTHANMMERLLEFKKTHEDYEELLTEVKNLRSEFNFSDTEQLHLYLSVIFDKQLISAASLEANKEIVLPLFDEEYDDRCILKAFEHLGMVEHEELFDNYALVCHWLYNNDIVEEEGFLRRYESLSEKGDVKKTDNMERMGRRKGAVAAAKFVQWLIEADSESEDELTSS